MKKIILLSLLLVGCAHKVEMLPIPDIKRVEVIILEGSAPISEKLQKHIIDRTNTFCLESGRPGVKRVTIFQRPDSGHTNVAYLCLGDGDPQTEEEVRKSKIPVRVTEEVLGGGKEIHYKTYKALVRGF